MTQPSPFDLAESDAWLRWRDAKLAGYPAEANQLIVEIGDPRQLTDSEHAALLERIRKTNMVIYAGTTGDDPDKALVERLGARFGLQRLDSNWLADEDGITSLTVNPEGPRPGYIPYTNRPINWHTDGYYNRADRQIHGLILHCVRPAAEGGDNALFDPELAYLRLREEEPELVRALMLPDAMTIPPGTDSEGGAREAAVGPVFSLRPDGSLHMRYTARKRNVIWKDDPILHTAVERLTRLLAEGQPNLFRARLEPGMGLLCNNVLHDRTGFTNPPEGPGRLIFRARYYDRIAGT